MRVRITFTGTSPLLCHNIQLADQDNEFAMAISEITSKRKKTKEDRAAISHLEWLGGMYVMSGIEGPAMPTGNIRKCIIQSAKVHRMGKQVARALHFTGLAVPIEYDGPKDLKSLYLLPQHVSRLPVRVQQSVTMRTRPQFPEWQVSAVAELLEDILNLKDLQRIVTLAGVSEGFGDNRNNGYGRFKGEVTNGKV